MRFLDANIFLRFLTGDHPDRAAACHAILKDLEDGLDEATTSDVILAEVVYVLTRGRYRFSREDVGLRLQAIVNSRGLRLLNKGAVQDALSLYLALPHLDFEDCLTVARMQSDGIEELYSYYKGFDRVPGITRLEPALA